QVTNLRHRLVFVGELEHIEVGVRHHDVLCLAADPAAHVDIAVGTAGTGRVHVEADAGLLLAAIPAASTRNVEWHRYEIANLDELHVWPGLDHLTGDLVAQHHTHRSSGPTPDHVLIAATDVGGDDLQDDPVIAL